jgi:hypothetical protein
VGAGDIFTLFSQWWNVAPPPDIMGYPSVFGRFHTELHRYISSHGKVPALSWVDTAARSQPSTQQQQPPLK